jgi:hypothetical protein
VMDTVPHISTHAPSCTSHAYHRDGWALRKDQNTDRSQHCPCCVRRGSGKRCVSDPSWSHLSLQQQHLVANMTAATHGQNLATLKATAARFYRLYTLLPFAPRTTCLALLAPGIPVGGCHIASAAGTCPRAQRKGEIMEGMAVHPAPCPCFYPAACQRVARSSGAIHAPFNHKAVAQGFMWGLWSCHRRAQLPTRCPLPQEGVSCHLATVQRHQQVC